MTQEEKLFDLSIASVKEACEKYLIDKDLSTFVNLSNMEDIPLIGLCTPDWTEEFKIESQHYQGYIQNSNQCMVLARLALKDTLLPSSNCILVDATVLCTLKGEHIEFACVHMTNPKRKALLYDPDVMKDSNYKKLLDCMYDLVIEYRFNDNSFVFSKEKYRNLFHKEANFLSTDQWFWEMCSTYVIKDDLEKMDMFRAIDVRKRIKNKEYIIKTNIRIQRDTDEIIWLRLVFALIPNDSETSIENVFILLKDCSVEMAEKMTNIMYARVDSLTQIWNRRYAEELISKRIKSYGKGIFIIFDIDNFKNVNDIFGHMTGDDLLRKISQIVSEKATEDDVFGRLGGDEFVLYLCGDYEDSINRFSEIHKNMRFDYYENDNKIEIHCSAGVAVLTSKDLTFYDLYEAADKVLYEAKRAGKNTYKIHLMEE